MEKGIIQRPLILVCNDDGVFAPGIKALVDVMLELGDVIVVAPDSPQSGMGHAITISDTIKIANMSNEVSYLKYSCSGTPVDCVKIGVNRLAPRRPDMVVSGINHGSNSSINVIYSGTMSAAMEGAVLGIPSIGFSLCDHSYEANFEPAKPFIRKIASEVLTTGLPNGLCLNVNIPKTEQIKGVKVCRQANAYWDEELDQRQDPRGGTYFWLTGVFRNRDQAEDTDEFALSQGYISVVPTQFDLTAYAQLNTLKERLDYVG